MPSNTSHTPTMQARVTLLTSTSGDLCKTLTVAGKTAAANLSSGSAQVCVADTPAQLAALLDTLTRTQAIALGTLAGGRTEGTLTVSAKAGGADGLIARTKRYFHHQPGTPGWLLWDYDDDAMPDHVRQRVADLGGPLKALEHIWPDAAHAARVVRPSSGGTGWHGYFRINDVATIRATLDALMARAWHHGLGWIKLSANGVQLERGLVDVAVHGPERIVFEAPPVIGPGVTAPHRVATQWQDGITLPGLVPDVDVSALIAAAKVATATEAAQVAAQWTEARIGSLIEATGLTPKVARTLTKRRVDGRLLDDRDMLQTATGGWFTVASILDDPDTWDGVGIPDPIEGLAYGADKATLLLKPRPDRPTEPPRLVSHAHGTKVVYRFQRVPEALPAMYPAPTVDRDVAIGMNRAVVAGWGKSGGRVMLTGAAGIGKTEAALAAILTMPDDCRVLMLVPDHQTATEALTRFEAMDGTGGVVLRGRSVVDPDPTYKGGRHMCVKHEEATKVANFGLNVQVALCLNCDLRWSCGYKRQEATLGDARVIFAPHEWADIPLPGGVKVDRVIFDEADRNDGIRKSRLTFEQLTTPITFEGKAEHREVFDNINAAHLWPLMQHVHIGAWHHPHHIVEYLRSVGFGPGAVSSAQLALELFYQADCTDVKETLKGKPKPIRALIDLAEAIRLDLEHGGSSIRVHEGVVHSRVLKRMAVCRDKPFLHLDATGDHAMAQALFGPMDHEHHPVERNARIIQVTGHEMGKYALTTSEFDRDKTVQADLEQIIADRPDAAVFSHKGFIAGKPWADRAGNFNGLRGRDRWKDRQTVIVIGRVMPPIADLEATAAAYAIHSGHVVQRGDLVRVWRGIRMVGGGVTPKEVLEHPDPWVQRVLVQARDKENEQAIDRGRLMFNERPKDVILIAPVVIDASISEVIDWQDFRQGGTRIERVWKGGRVLPLSGRECARMYPDIWGSKSAADRDLKTLRLHSLLYRVRYKTKKHGSKRIDAAVLGDFKSLRILTEFKTGSLSEFLEFPPGVGFADLGY